MKARLINCLLLLTIPIFCFAQYWAPKGAVWYYEQNDFVPPFYNNYVVHRSLGDTVINGDTSQILERRLIYVNSPGDTVGTKDIFYTKFDSNRVYVYYSPANAFRMLYDFNAEARDTFQVFCPESETDSSITVVVDSISYLVVSNDTLKVQHVSQPNFEMCRMAGTIIEHIGWTGYMFPQHSWRDPPDGGPLRCYEDSIIGLYHRITSIPCDYLVTDREEIKVENELTLYPNPSSGRVVIRLPLKVEKIQLFSSVGNLIREYGNETEIDVSDLESGIYFMIFVKEGERITKRIIKTASE
jgi:hypothetical protein